MTVAVRGVALGDGAGVDAGAVGVAGPGDEVVGGAVSVAALAGALDAQGAREVVPVWLVVHKERAVDRLATTTTSLGVDRRARRPGM